MVDIQDCLRDVADQRWPQKVPSTLIGILCFQSSFCEFWFDIFSDLSSAKNPFQKVKRTPQVTLTASNKDSRSVKTSVEPIQSCMLARRIMVIWKKKTEMAHNKE